ncbi:MAG: hypothetical protein ABIO37_08580 [Caulobacteraceae bacterium]
MKLRFAGLAAAMLALTLAAPATQAQAPRSGGCDRACLEGLTNQYLAALVAHDVKRAPIAPGARFTENTNELKLGDGLWQTAGALGSDKMYIADPQMGQIAFYGTIKENGVTALLALRLKASGGKLTEIEQMVVRKASNSFGNFDKMTPITPAWRQAVPAKNRSSRAQLIHAANQYFEGIEQGNGQIVPFDDNGTRIENGLLTAPSKATADRPAMTVREQFDSKIFNYITKISHRRFLAIDEERGIAFAIVMFKHPGNVLEVNSPRFGKVKVASELALYPNTTEIIEAFKIDSGRIREIYAYVSVMPYEQRPGWPDMPAVK